jgi:phage-related protein
MCSVDRPPKAIEFCGTALEDLSRFPPPARRKAGYQLFVAQQGDDPEDWKPMTAIGSGVREIRIRDKEGAFRVIYVASFVDAVYVLHCFQKKTQKTATVDIELARRRYKSLLKELRP